MTDSSGTDKQSKSKDGQEKFEFVLPVKITGVVFWGLALVGLIIAVFLLQGKEQELEASYQRNSILFAAQMEYELQEKKSDSTLELTQYLQRKLPLYQEVYQFNSFSLDFKIQQLSFGSVEDGDFFVSIPVQTVIKSNNEITAYPLLISYPNLKNTVIAERKNLLLSIGALVFFFGLLLQKVLQYILNKPFSKLLNAARRFARGDTSVRFDESTKDEFGFLSKFINEALDSIVQQQREIYRALSRAKKSELALYKEKELAEVTLHSITDAVITTNSRAMLLYMNPVAERLLGWKKDEIEGKLIDDVLELRDESSGERIKNPLLDLLSNRAASQECVKGNCALKNRSGGLVSIELSVAPMTNQTGKMIGGVVVFQDVSDARRLNHELSFQAQHDALTGLFNRRLFERRLIESIEDAKNNAQEHALCYLDFDQFKVVNDTCGHMAGDELLRQLAKELLNSIRDTDFLARLGGDEFGILLTQCSLEEAEKIANNIRKNIKNFRFTWGSRFFEVGVSIGVVAINQQSEKTYDILSAADLACYAAKDGGRNRIHIYRPTDEDLTKRQTEMHYVTRINHALENDLFAIYKQAIVALGKDSDTAHWEVLLNMKNKAGDIIPPDDFISAAERYNLMPKIDRMVLKKTFEAMSAGHFYQTGLPYRVVGINLSGDSISDESFLAYIKEQAENYGIDFKEVCLEITETVAIANLAKASDFMMELKGLGCQFALDDFGSGLSSFGYLKNLPVDYLKIDGSFVKDMTSDKIDHAMVESINQVGHILGMKTIAEWVEDDETFSLLKEMGVDYSQGFHTGKPMPLVAKQ
jgi:diguanylate cyclase (GGDEF)-like protein/PAS domain S-box-containing protein